MDDADDFPSIGSHPFIVSVRRNDRDTVQHLWECYDCGAMVIDFRAHVAWHNHIRFMLTVLGKGLT